MENLGEKDMLRILTSAVRAIKAEQKKGPVAPGCPKKGTQETHEKNNTKTAETPQEKHP